MYHDFFAKSPLLGFPLIALIIFMAVFAIITIRAYGRTGRELEKTASRMPLEDDMIPARAPAPARASVQEGSHE